jgi:hypothetical protein
VIARDRMLDLLPPPLTADPASVLGQLLDVVSLDLEALGEDVERERRTHWVDFAYRVEDLEKLGALVGVPRLAWEDREAYRARLVALVVARLHGAVGPGEIRAFVHDYLVRAERGLRTTFVPGLARLDADGAYQPQADHPLYRPLALVENPVRVRRSATLLARGGRVPYLFRWQEANHGLADTVVEISLTGFPGGRTAVPILLDITGGDLIGYAGVVRCGQVLRIAPAADDDRTATATLDGRDVSGRLFGRGGFALGTPFTTADLDAVPLVPRLVRGTNDWIYLSAGLLDVRGLDHVFFALADAQLEEGAFGHSRFDHALFPQGPVTRLELSWPEVQPAAFDVHVPWQVTLAPGGEAGVRDEVAEALAEAIGELHAAGVLAQLRLDAFAERQDQQARVQLPWIALDAESGPTGSVAQVGLGARFDDAALSTARFE